MTTLFVGFGVGMEQGTGTTVSQPIATWESGSTRLLALAEVRTLASGKEAKQLHLQLSSSASDGADVHVYVSASDFSWFRRGLLNIQALLAAVSHETSATTLGGAVHQSGVRYYGAEEFRYSEGRSVSVMYFRTGDVGGLAFKAQDGSGREYRVVDRSPSDLIAVLDTAVRVLQVR